MCPDTLPAPQTEAYEPPILALLRSKTSLQEKGTNGKFVSLPEVRALRKLLSVLANETRLKAFFLIAEHTDGISYGDLQVAMGFEGRNLSGNIEELRENRVVRIKKKGRHTTYFADTNVALTVFALLSKMAGKKFTIEKIVS